MLQVCMDVPKVVIRTNCCITRHIEFDKKLIKSAHRSDVASPMKSNHANEFGLLSWNSAITVHVNSMSQLFRFLICYEVRQYFDLAKIEVSEIIITTYFVKPIR